MDLCSAVDFSCSSREALNSLTYCLTSVFVHTSGSEIKGSSVCENYSGEVSIVTTTVTFIIFTDDCCDSLAKVLNYVTLHEIFCHCSPCIVL